MKNRDKFDKIIRAQIESHIILSKNNVNLTFDLNYDLKENKQQIFIDNKNITELDYNTMFALLQKFGCSNNEITDFELFQKYETIDKNRISIILDEEVYKKRETIFDKYIKTPNAVINKKSELELFKLPNEKAINIDTYNKLPKDKQALYNQCRNSIQRFNDYKYLTEFINKYQKYIVDINSYITVYNDSYIKIHINKIHNNYNAIITKDVYLYGEKLIIDTIPIHEINKELAEFFNDFNESKFTKDLKPNILKKLNKNIKPEFSYLMSNELSDKIDKLKNKALQALIKGKPNPLTLDEIKITHMWTLITLNTDKCPDGYIFLNKSIKINQDYIDLLTGATPKNVNLNDIIYLFDFIHNKIL